MFSFCHADHNHLSDRELIIKVLENQSKIMSAISDFAAKQDANNAAIDSAIAGLSTDIDTLNAEIKTLQGSAGAITPEDQATLDRLDAAGQSAADKLDALDAQTPPPVPPAA